MKEVILSVMDVKTEVKDNGLKLYIKKSNQREGMFIVVEESDIGFSGIFEYTAEEIKTNYETDINKLYN